MALFQKKSPLEKERQELNKREAAFLAGREKKKDTKLNQFLADKVPAKLQASLDDAFEKAFTLIFEKGTVAIEKTYKKQEKENTYKINAYANEVSQNKKTLKAFSKEAKSAGSRNLMISGATGIGMGLLGIGIPDIPIFTGMIFRSIYEIALSYGYEYESEQEQYFILMLIEGSASYGDKFLAVNEKIDAYIKEGILPADYDRKVQVKGAAKTLSGDLLYMKFLQGVPLVGAVGGAYDIVYMKAISEYAQLKYRKRFLNERG